MRKLQSKSMLSCLVATSALIFFSACEPDDPNPDVPANPIVGQQGNPQFNLHFTNEAQVDMDLYVEDPQGSIIYYANVSSASGGQLDVDCLCSVCPNGPNENIFWPLDDSAPKGTYRYWVEYFGSCDGSNASSTYTVRVIRNGSIVNTEIGTLSAGSTPVWTYVHD